MATKRSKRSGTKSTAKRSSKAARPAARPKPAKPAAKAAAKAAARPAGSARGPSLEERTLALRDAIQHSKLTAADPWGYSPKARAWQARADKLFDRLGTGAETAETRKAVDALAAEVEGDRDFQEARRLF